MRASLAGHTPKHWLTIVLSLVQVLAILLFSALFLFQGTTRTLADGGAYSIKWTAADPSPNSGPSGPTYAKVSPGQLSCPTPSGSAGRAADPLANALFGNPQDAVPSLAPKDMALGQIVPFETAITVRGNTLPENGVIQFTPYFLAKTTSGGDFGFDPTYGIYCAFVDAADPAAVGGTTAKVDSYSWSIANPGTANEQITGPIQLSGLHDGDTVIVEIWVVLKDDIQPGVTGNVQTGFVSAQAVSSPADTINSGNQTVPLLRVQDFFNSQADLSITKSDSPDPVTQGQQLAYSIEARNNSATTVANGVVVADYLDSNTAFVSASGATCSESSGVITCNVGALTPGQSVTIGIVTTVSSIAPTDSDLSAGPQSGGPGSTPPAGVDISNTATVTAITSDSNAVNNSYYQPTNVLSAFVAMPGLSLAKTASPTTYSVAGQTVTYLYLVSNSGNVTLAGPFSVADDKATVTCPSASSLAPGIILSCSANYVVTQADIDAGSVTNVATATNGTITSNQATATVAAVQTRALSLTKIANPTTYSAAGQTVIYDYTVSNSGNVTLAGPFSVNDDKTTVACPSSPSLAPGANLSCSASYVVTQADLDSGSVTNVAAATNGTVASNQATATVAAVRNPALSLGKTANPTAYSAVGQVVTYDYEVSNSGNVTLSGPFSVNDDKTTVTCPSASSLAPGSSLSCSASYVVTQADLDRGSVTNIATATNGTISSNQATATVTAVQTRALSLTKTAAPTTYDAVGQTVSYVYLIVNSGNVTLGGPFSVTDDKTTVSCPSTSSLAPGASFSCSANYIVTQADLDAGSVTNIATATNGTLSSNQATATVTAIQNPAISLAKSAASSTYSSVGQTIVYHYVIANTGDVTLAGPFAITDDHIASPFTCGTGTVAPGATTSCDASYTITQADLDSGSVTNIAVASGNGVASPPATATVTAVQTWALSLTKTAAPTTYATVGQSVSYAYLIVNSGNVTLGGPFSVTDDKTTVSCPSASSLAPGASLSCSASYVITQADLDSGSVTNIAAATNGTISSNQATATVTAVQNPALSLTKTANPTTYSAAGQVITYKYTASNSGNVTLSGPFTIGDDKLGTFGCGSAASLPPGAALTCSANYTIKATDLNATNDASVTNTATASGAFAGKAVVSNPVQATVRQVPPLGPGPAGPFGQITPTGTTCSQFASGTAPDLGAMQYLAKGGKIVSVNPGVFFYYSKVTAPSTGFTLQVRQTNDKAWAAMGIQTSGQVVLYDATCTKANAQGVTTFDPTSGTVSIAVNGATSGSVYYIGIKYDPNVLVGKAATVPNPTVTYGFGTYLNGSEVTNSGDSLAVVPKK